MAGGEFLRNAAKQEGVTYEEYCKDPSPIPINEQHQIEKDIARTSITSMQSKDLDSFWLDLARLSPSVFAQMMSSTPSTLPSQSPDKNSTKEDEEKNISANKQFVQNTLRRMLTSFVKRNRRIGYSQGLDHFALFLLAFQEESIAFWTMCAMVEKVRLPDFYSRPPTNMNGFLIEQSVLKDLAAETFPDLVDQTDDGAFTMAMEVVSAKWLIVCMIDLLRLPASIFVLDRFFIQGDTALLKASLTIIESCREEIAETGDLLVPLLEGAKKVSLETMKDGLMSSRFTFPPSRMAELRSHYRHQLSLKWTREAELLSLAKNTSFTKEELKNFQAVYIHCNGGEKKQDQGLTKAQFQLIINRTAPHLNEETVNRFFSLYDHDGSGRVDFRELVFCLSVLCSEDPEERCRMAFDVFDTERTGFLAGDKFMPLALSLITMLGNSLQDEELCDDEGPVVGPYQPGQTKEEKKRRKREEKEKKKKEKEEKKKRKQEDKTKCKIKPEDKVALDDAPKDCAAQDNTGSRMKKKRDEEVQRLYTKLRMLDTDGDNKISFSEFLEGVRSEPAIARVFQVTEIFLFLSSYSIAPFSLVALTRVRRYVS